MHDDERMIGAIAEALRSDVAPRPEWRRALQQRLDGEAAALGRSIPGARRAAGISMRLPTAIAASLALVALGAVGGASLSSRDSSPDASRDSSPRIADGSRAIGNTVGVRFAVVAPGVQRVSLVGDFNGWDPGATPLQRERDQQTWSILLPMTQGRHSYAFVIDGAVVADPTAPSAIDDDFGTPSSLMLVSRETR